MSGEARRDELERLSDEFMSQAVTASRDLGVCAVVSALGALRLAVLAAAAPPGPPGTGETWTRVELFGHTTVYGLVREVELAGRRFLEVAEPAVSGTRRPRFVPDGEPAVEEFPERRKTYNPSAVYALEEVAEGVVLNAVRRQRGLDFDADAEPDEVPF